jgi:hypothetical protein
MKFLFKFYLCSLLFFPAITNAQTTLDEIINDMTLSHEGRPHGVPASFDWGLKPRVGAQQPPAGWNAAIAWGQVYEWLDGNPAKNTRVQIKDLEMYYLSKTDHKWHLLQKSVGVDGNAYVENFAGDVNKPADKRNESDGSVSVKAGDGYNFHFWSKLGRVKYPANDVAGCYVTVKARLILDNPSGTDDRASARYLMSVGGDWWQSLSAVWDQWKTNADMGIGRFRFISEEWKSFNMFTAPIDTIRNNPPPFLSVATSVNQFLHSNDNLKLEQNYPNPFSNSTKIKFSLSVNDRINISAFNSNGAKIETLINKAVTAGSYSINWDTSKLPQGIYHIVLENKQGLITEKCQLIR